MPELKPTPGPPNRGPNTLHPVSSLPLHPFGCLSLHRSPSHCQSQYLRHMAFLIAYGPGSSTTLTRHRRCLILSSLSGSVDHLVLTADHLATSSFFPPISPTLTILSIYQAFAITVDRTLIPPHRLVSSHDPPSICHICLLPCFPLAAFDSSIHRPVASLSFEKCNLWIEHYPNQASSLPNPLLSVRFRGSSCSNC